MVKIVPVKQKTNRFNRINLELWQLRWVDWGGKKVKG
jgi:hypothetical protein